MCRLDRDIGTLEAGKEFDALWIKPKSMGMWNMPTLDQWKLGIRANDGDNEMMHERKGDELKVRRMWEKWIWTGDDRDLASVWVRGRRVVHLQ